MASGGSTPLPPLPSSSDASTALSGTPKTVICVFCGAFPGHDPIYMAAARQLAHEFHKNNISLVFGGGTVGLMGEIARTLVSLSGPDSVHGIIPSPLVRYEQAGTKDASSTSASTEDSLSLPPPPIYGRTTVVPDMHTRKRLMAASVIAGGPGSGFIALPGGYGTLEELMEIVTWNQLGIHERGIVLLNVGGYWDSVLEWIRGAVEKGFVGEGNKGIVVECKEPREVVQALRGYRIGEGRFKLEWGGH